jgi:hypothetical protein
VLVASIHLLAERFTFHPHFFPELFHVFPDAVVNIIRLS